MGFYHYGQKRPPGLLELIGALIEKLLLGLTSKPAPLEPLEEKRFVSGNINHEDIHDFYKNRIRHLSPLDPNTAAVVFEPPEGMDILMCSYLYSGKIDTSKLIYVLIVDLISRGLAEFRYSAARGCYILETLRPCEDFYTLPPLEREAAFILLGSRFIAGRLYTFDGINVFVHTFKDFMEDNLNYYSKYYGPSAKQHVLAFRRYLDVGERLRLPGANPENEALLFVNKNIRYLAYAAAFDLENYWKEYYNPSVYIAVYQDLTKTSSKNLDKFLRADYENDDNIYW